MGASGFSESSLPTRTGSKMEFHNYTTLRNQMIRHGDSASLTDWAEGASSEAFRWSFFDASLRASREGPTPDYRLHYHQRAVAAIAEAQWVEIERPFYNVWPIAVEFSRN